MQRDWGRENELNPILGFSGDCTPEHPPRSLHSIGQIRCVTHEWGGLEEIKSMVQEDPRTQALQCDDPEPVLRYANRVCAHSRCGVGVP